MTDTEMNKVRDRFYLWAWQVVYERLFAGEVDYTLRFAKALEYTSGDISDEVILKWAESHPQDKVKIRRFVAGAA